MIRSRRAASAVGAAMMLMLASCGGGSSDSASSDEFCKLAKRADRSGEAIDAAMESEDAKEIEAALTDALDDAQAAAKAAPEEIKSVVATVNDSMEEFVKILADYDYDLMKAIEDEDLNSLMSDPDVEDANTELDEYLFDECGIEPDSTDAGTDDTTAAGGEVVVTDTSVAEALDTTIAPSSSTVELSAEVGGTTVGTEDDPTVVYAAVITNTTEDPAYNLSINFTIYGATDLVVGTGSTTIDLILPGQSRAVSGTASVTEPAARIEANYSGDVGLPYGTSEADLPDGEFTFEGTQLKQDDYSVAALGLRSSYQVNLDSVEVQVVFRDDAGSIIGGAFTYVDVLANGQVGIEPTQYYAIPGVASFDLYAAYSVYGLGD